MGQGSRTRVGGGAVGRLQCFQILAGAEITTGNVAPGLVHFQRRQQALGVFLGQNIPCAGRPAAADAAAYLSADLPGTAALGP